MARKFLSFSILAIIITSMILESSMQASLEMLDVDFTPGNSTNRQKRAGISRAYVDKLKTCVRNSMNNVDMSNRDIKCVISQMYHTLVINEQAPCKNCAG